MTCEFVIEVAAGAAPDLFSTRVVHAVSGGEPTEAMQLDVDDLVRGLPALENSVLASAVSARRALPVAEQQLRQVGERLFRSLFVGEVYGTYRACLGIAQQRGEHLRVVLRLTVPKLAALPWEALFDPETGSYLCRKEPLVRHVPAPYTAPPLPVEGPLRILVVIASPRGLPALQVGVEQDRLSAALAGPIRDGLVELHWLPQATWSAVHDELMAGPWHVLHFIGHGDYSVERDQGLIALVGEDGREDLVEAERLADLLHEAEPTPRLVVLNSCASGHEGAVDLFSGTASALARSGINAVAAMQFSVSDDAALDFARGFYTAIAHGRGVDAAARSGRIEILGVPSSLEWVTPVLYLRGDATTLFDLRAPRTPAVQRPPALGPGPGPVPSAVVAAPVPMPTPVPAARGPGQFPPAQAAPGAPMPQQHPEVGVVSTTVAARPKRWRWVVPLVLVAAALLAWVGFGPLMELLNGQRTTQTQVLSPAPQSAGSTVEPSVKPPVEPPDEPPAEPPALPESAVPLQAAGSPGVLNPDLVWHQGGTRANAYSLSGDGSTLTLVAGPDTMNWGDAETAPMVLYDLDGDFDFVAQVRAASSSGEVVPRTGFGFGVRSKSDPTRWLQLTRSQLLFATQNADATQHLNQIQYSEEAVHLRIERNGGRYALSYSRDGASWDALLTDSEFELPGGAELYLLAFAADDRFEAQFSDFRVLK